MSGANARRLKCSAVPGIFVTTLAPGEMLCGRLLHRCSRNGPADQFVVFELAATGWRTGDSAEVWTFGPVLGWRHSSLSSFHPLVAIAPPVRNYVIQAKNNHTATVLVSAAPMVMQTMMWFAVRLHR